jgi:hypothetical protein
MKFILDAGALLLVVVTGLSGQLGAVELKAIESAHRYLSSIDEMKPGKRETLQISVAGNAVARDSSG